MLSEVKSIDPPESAVLWQAGSSRPQSALKVFLGGTGGPPLGLIGGTWGYSLKRPLAFPSGEIKIGWMETSRPQLAMKALRDAKQVILPSLLQCDFGNLQREIEQLEAAGVHGLHLDVMDGHFVPNLSYGMPIVAGIRKLTELPIDVHLMVSEPAKYARQFVDAGADCLTVHIEVRHAEVPQDVGQTLQLIRSLGVGVGLALNPDTPLASAMDLLPLCDLLLIMSVNAGFGGQVFNPIALDKLAAAKVAAPKLLLEVDGGVNLTTISKCHAAGASLFVVGSAVFGQKDYRQALRQLTEALGG